MRTLIIPDIHTRWQIADDIINFENPDLTICLGDFFDQWNDHLDPNLNRRTAIWLKKKLHDPKFIALLGNHDLHYQSSSRIVRCSGYSDSKDSIINDILNYDDWDRFRWYYILDGWLLTHAGLSEQNLPPISFFKNGFNLYNLNRWLDREIEIASQFLQVGKHHWLYGAGYSRGGNFPIGGINWCDFREEFHPIEGIKQIFGHTEIGTPQWLKSAPLMNSLDVADWDKMKIISNDHDWNLCLDTCNEFYVILNDGIPEIKQRPK